MKKIAYKLFPLLFLFTLAGTPALFAESATAYKQLAAPPEMWAEMQLPNAQENGITSHSAMLPITFVNGAWSADIPLEAAERLNIMALSNGAAWDVTLTATTAATQSLNLNRAAQLRSGAVQAAESTFGMNNTQFAGTQYTLSNFAGGVHTVRITTDSTQTQGYLLITNEETNSKLYTHLAHYDLVAGNSIGLVSYAADANGNRIDGLQSATITLTRPDGTVSEQTMAIRPDGSFTGNWSDLTAGTYTAQVIATGVNSNGAPIIRTSEHLFPVVADSVRLTTIAAAQTVSDNRAQIDLKIESAQADTYMVAAELWGTQNGDLVPVSWIGGMSAVDGDTLPLTFDMRWIARSGATAPFVLKNVRVQDQNTHIPVETAAQIVLLTEALPEVANTRGAVRITPEMLMGERPTLAQSRSSSNGMAGAQLLVHGYCSGDVWSSNDFDNDAKFEDYDQNRTHDQFAQRIRDFGDAYDSYNIIAHSQGGAASLHLYTYYWSGLDYTDSSRLVQSVGTPYQGTSLAGNLAALGDIFGVGCDTNWDLTYDGAALWLSGIPSWSRDDIYYYTTSFATKWWRYDYCSIATDPFLGDPEDGTTEQSKGQLSGGNNMGHKKGWCHTASMRDPQQTTDPSRNATMNSYRQTRSAAGVTSPKVVIDGNLDDWSNGNDQCNLTQCVTDNQFSHLYLLNDVSMATDTFCTHLDTDSDGALNYTVCHDGTIDTGDFVTLTACDNSAATCEQPEEVATFAIDGYNAADSSIEIGIGLADVGLGDGDTVCLSNSVSSDTMCHTITANSAPAPLAISLNSVSATQTAVTLISLLITVGLSGALFFTRRA